ncbi:MAG: 5-(carboxyamino)imidazole ribonucleotide mutase [Archaeoglobi archaeon]|nr:AIR carboxylase family protein [Candidatus Mnemosynella bozhongmuii]MDI3502669.1 5-(carboxyamino)imidazole ribonucleotide mutase [Archaeoglobi archaeon]
MPQVVILMGSKSDAEFVKRIENSLKLFGVSYERRVASAHKTPEKLLKILKEYPEDVVYITVAGRSNALSGMVDASVTSPVIACPPYSEKFGGADIFSSLRMPSGVAPLVVLEPESAALAAAKILGMRDEEIRKRVEEYQRRMKEEIERADEEMRGEG